MKLQQLYSKLRQAVDAYHMIQANDKIAVGVSGGKDSLALLYALSGLRQFYPMPFEIIAITVDLGYDSGFDTTEIRALCNKLGVEYHVIDTQIAAILQQTDAISCSLCAKMRKGALNAKARELKCSKIAYAHHMDDFVETALLSLLYGGRFYCFPPVTFFEDTELTVIRPLMFVKEKDLTGFQNKYQLPVLKNPCPVDGTTKRAYVKELLTHIQKENPKAKSMIFHAIQTAKFDDWFIIRTENDRNE